MFRGKPRGSHIRAKVSFVPEIWNSVSGLFALIIFCPRGVRGGATARLSIEIGPAQEPVKSRFGAAPPEPLFFSLLNSVPASAPPCGGFAGEFCATHTYEDSNATEATIAPATE